MIRENKLIESKRNFAVVCAIGVIVIPALYLMGILSIGDVNMLGRFMTFAILALGLDLLWGYVGILSLCQFTFFCFGAYAMGMHLAHHGGPEGIIDNNGWKIPACLFVVYPYDIGESSGDALVPVLETLLEPAFDGFFRSVNSWNRLVGFGILCF